MAVLAALQRRDSLLFSLEDEPSEQEVVAPEPETPSMRGAARKSARRAASLPVSAGNEMKAMSQQIKTEMQARVTLLETPLAFSEALAVMMGLAQCHLPEEQDETELLRLVAEQAATLASRAPSGPSFLLRESCSPVLMKVRSAAAADALRPLLYHRHDPSDAA